MWFYHRRLVEVNCLKALGLWEKIEYDRCAADPVYFANKYIKITTYDPKIAEETTRLGQYALKRLEEYVTKQHLI